MFMKQITIVMYKRLWDSDCFINVQKITQILKNECFMLARPNMFMMHANTSKDEIYIPARSKLLMTIDKLCMLARPKFFIRIKRWVCVQGEVTEEPMIYK